MDSSLPGSSVHGIFQERVLEWVAISFSKQTKPKQNPKLVKKKKNDIIKIRAEIHEKEMKDTIANINKTVSWFLRR